MICATGFWIRDTKIPLGYMEYMCLVTTVAQVHTELWSLEFTREGFFVNLSGECRLIHQKRNPCTSLVILEWASLAKIAHLLLQHLIHDGVQPLSNYLFNSITTPFINGLEQVAYSQLDEKHCASPGLQWPLASQLLWYHTTSCITISIFGDRVVR